MRRVAAIALCLLICTNSFASEPPRGEQPQGDKETREVKTKEKTERDQARKKKQPTWPRPYKPREEISADTTVPFPTDI